MAVSEPAGRHAELALVLSGGGARAAYQVGVLAAIAERLSELEFPILTGVSAGAINTIYLAAHRGSFAAAISGLVKEWGRLTVDQVYCVRPFSMVRSLLTWSVRTWLGRRSGLVAVRGLMGMRPLARFLDGCIDLAGIDDNLAIARIRAVALSATSLTTGCPHEGCTGGARLTPIVDGRLLHFELAGLYDGVSILRDLIRAGVLYGARGRRQRVERPLQLFTRWYGFALTFPRTTVYSPAR